MIRLTIVGDALLDRDVEGEAARLAPDSPAPVLDEREIRTRPGGAGLAAVLAAADGAEVTLVTALGPDAAGAELEALLVSAGVRVVDLGLGAPTPEKIRLRAAGVSIARWDRGRPTGPQDIGAATMAAQQAVEAADGVLVSCYGRGLSAHTGLRAALAAAAARVPVTWDPHPRGSDPVPSCAVVTPNESEAVTFVGEVEGTGLEAVTARAQRLVHRWAAAGVAVTRGADGVLFTTGEGLPLAVPAPVVRVGDACGAGDRFASAVAVALAGGELTSVAVTGAVQLAASFVAAGGAAGVRVEAGPQTHDAAETDARQLADRVRRGGGTVVATGGCFDLVHAGHVHLLEAARALGDCLIVCLNSDASVRRLKGDGRPIVPEADRAELLRALSCVDAVVVFEEDTPVAVLSELRPDVFAKGGDYGSVRIPEAELLASWGGQAVTLPYLQGRSTSRLLEEVRARD